MKKMSPSHMGRLAILGCLLLPLTHSVKAASVTVDATNVFQQIVGFGTSNAGWSGTMIAYYQTPAFMEHYLDEMGMSMYRMPLWPDVLPQTPVATDINYSLFNTTIPRAKSYIDMAINLRGKSLRENEPTVKLIMSAWSPPAWMKSNGNINNGGNLLPAYYNHYAYYLLAWCKYLDEEIDFRPYALSFQNELLFSQSYESCVWTVPQYVNFLKVLGPILEDNGYGDILIFGPEHMTHAVQDNMDFVNGIMADSEAAPYFDVVASHGYTNGIQADTDPQSATRLFSAWRQYPLQYWMTETSGEEATYAGALDGVAASIHNSLVGGRCSAYVYWQLTSPNTNEYLRTPGATTPKYYAFKHYSRWIRPDSWLVNANVSDATKLDVSAFVHEAQQTLTMVLLNRHTETQVINLELLHTPGLSSFEVYRTTDGGENTAKITDIAVDSNGNASFTMPARSFVTLVGSLSGYEKPEYTTDLTPMNVSAGSGEIIIPVSATDENGTWRVEGTVNWLTSETPTGTGSGQAVVRISRNSTANARTAPIEISGQLLFISQPGNPGLTFAGYGTTVSGNGTFGEVAIEAFGTDGRNRQWTATSSADWLTLTSASGTGSGTISFTADKNSSMEPRTATITLEAETYTVTQEASNGSIFPAFGWSPSLGFYYDGFYPFIYLWTSLEWIYIPEGYTYEEGFFFWRFNAEHWGFTAGEWLPWYFPFTESGAGDAIDLTVPME